MRSEVAPRPWRSLTVCDHSFDTVRLDKSSSMVEESRRTIILHHFAQLTASEPWTTTHSEAMGTSRRNSALGRATQDEEHNPSPASPSPTCQEEPKQMRATSAVM